MAKVIKSSDPQTDRVARFERDALKERPPVVEQEPCGAAQVAKGLDPAEVLAEARSEAERVVRAAYAEGLRRGMEAGRARFLESVGQSAQALQKAADAMVEAREKFLASIEPQVVELVKKVARRVLHREIEEDGGDLLRNTVRAALKNLAERERVTLRLNPADLETIRREKVALLEQFEAVQQLEMVGDDTVGPGGCIAETELLHIDARLDAQLERILETLTE